MKYEHSTKILCPCESLEVDINIFTYFKNNC